MDEFRTNLFVFFFQGEFLFLHYFQLVSEIEFCRFLLEFCKFVFIFRDFLQCWFNAKYKNNNIKYDCFANQTEFVSTYNFPRKSLTWLFNSLIYNI